MRILTSLLRYGRNALAIERELATSSILQNLEQQQIPAKGFNFTAFNQPSQPEATQIVGPEELQTRSAQVSLVFIFQSHFDQ